MTFRRVLFAALAALGAVLAASPAAAAPIGRHPAPISSITLTREGTGTLIRVTYLGATRPHTRVLRAPHAGGSAPCRRRTTYSGRALTSS